MNTPAYSHPRIPEVLEAFELLLNDSMALDYCGITGKERKLILNDSNFIKEAKKIKAGKYLEEIKDINEIAKSLKKNNYNENARVGDAEEDPSKMINLKMKVGSLRREILSLTTNDRESDESDSLNIFFLDVSREDFERMLNVEIHDGDENARLVGDENKDAPEMTATRKKEEGKQRTTIPAELAKNTIEYVDAHGDRIIEEVQE